MAPDSDQSYLTMRVSPNGRASAFQADDASSIPATRSRVSWRSDPTRLPVEEEIAGLNPAGTAMLQIVRVWCRDSVVLIWYQDGVMRRDLSVLFSYN